MRPQPQLPRRGSGSNDAGPGRTPSPEPRPNRPLVTPGKPINIGNAPMPMKKGGAATKASAMDKMGRALKNTSKDAKGRAMKKTGMTGYGGMMAMKKGGSAKKGK